MRSWMVAAVLVVACPAPVPARAQEGPCSGWTEPVLVDVEVRIERPDGRLERLRFQRDGLTIPMGGSARLEITGLDQDGYEFPVERTALEIVPDRDARGLVTIRDDGEGRFRIRARDRRGKGRLLIRAANNLNLEWPVRVRIEGPGADGYSRAEATFVATALYHALLGRDPDPEGLAAATAEIERGRLRAQVRGMLTSAEFRQKASSLSAVRMLDRLYRGLLGREPDADGTRQYLHDLERRRLEKVVLSILDSEEFARRLLHATGQRPGRTGLRRNPRLPE